LGDGVNTNPVPFLDHFPYLSDPGAGANPQAGYGSKLKQASTPAAQAALAPPAAHNRGNSVSTGGWVAIFGGAILLAGLAFAVGGRRTR
jgi:hypothetical protein